MKIHRAALLITALLIASSTLLAQQKASGIHISTFAARTGQSQAPTIPQLAGKWDILSIDPGGDPYNAFGGSYLGPIEFTADFTQNVSALTQVAGHTFSSSACSADGTATIAGTIDPDGDSGNASVTFTATVDMNYTYAFAGKYNKNTPNQISGTWSTSGGACGLQMGQFIAYQYNQLTNYSYSGELTSDVNGTSVNGVTLNIKEANDFSVSGSVIGPANSCFKDLTVNSTQSYTTGGVVELVASNSQGALVAFSASNTDSLFQQLPNDQPNEISLYLTYVVFQSGGYCQQGDSGHDAVFHLRLSPPVRHPIYPRRGR